MMTKMPKFRAWDKFDKVMRDVTLLDYNQNFVGYSYPVFMKSTMHMELMQATGLKDKDGQEIFEGDILTDEGSELEDGWVYVSVISKDGMYYCQENNPHGISGPLIDFIQCYSVVGNIYENLELLENKEE